MARVFNGVLHYTSAEMAEKFGGSQQMWSHYARTGKVPAVKWVDEIWYFNPKEVDRVGVKPNAFVGQAVNETVD